MNTSKHQWKRKRHQLASKVESSSISMSIQELIHQENSDEINIKKKKKKNKKKKRNNDEKIINLDISSNSIEPAISDSNIGVIDNNNNDNNSSSPSSSLLYPYTIQDDDHCETPCKAYEDIVPLLRAVATALGKSPNSLRIYDPYYCEGSVVSNLASLGFTDVYNRLEDFYAKIACNSIPEYDVLVTNPPYSGDNMARLLSFCKQSKKPWFLLLPNYVYMKDYYQQILSANTSNYSSSSVSANTSATVPRADSLFYVSPKQRYQYLTPKGRRQQKSAKVTSPFPTFWYCFGSSLLPIRNVASLCDTRLRVDVSMGSPSSLPLVALPDSDPRKKRLRNAEKRKKHKNRKKGDPINT